MAVETKEQVVPDREELLKRFIESCSQKGLLARPDSLEERDSAEGLLDQPTLLYGATSLPHNISVPALTLMLGAF